MLLVGVMILSIRDSWCSYHQDLKSICSSFQFLFPWICCLAEFQFQMILWIVGIQLLVLDFFLLNRWKSLPAWTWSFRFFLEMICEVTFQMMKPLILDSWRLSTKISEFGCWISRHGESRWQELFLDGNKSYQILPQEKLDVSLRQNQPISAFFDGSQCFWYAVAVARSDDFVHLWLLMFVPPRSEINLQLVSVSFPKICCLAEFQFEMILWIVGFQLFGDFFVLYQWSGLASWVPSFRVSLRWVS